MGIQNQDTSNETFLGAIWRNICEFANAGPDRPHLEVYKYDRQGISTEELMNDVNPDGYVLIGSLENTIRGIGRGQQYIEAERSSYRYSAQDFDDYIERFLDYLVAEVKTGNVKGFFSPAHDYVLEDWYVCQGDILNVMRENPLPDGQTEREIPEGEIKRRKGSDRRLPNFQRMMAAALLLTNETTAIKLDQKLQEGRLKQGEWAP